MTGTQLYLRLLGYVRPYWKIFAASTVGMLIAAGTEVAMPAAAKPFLDGTFINKDPVLMRWVPWLLVLLFLVRGVGSFLGQYASSWVAMRVIMDLRQQMFAASDGAGQHVVARIVAMEPQQSENCACTAADDVQPAVCGDQAVRGARADAR